MEKSRFCVKTFVNRTHLTWVLYILGILAGCVPRQPNATMLVSQLHGEQCRFFFDRESGKCVPTGLFTRWVTRDFKYRCIADSADCMRVLKLSQALPDLISALIDGPNNVDAGDGILPLRSAVAAAIGELGDVKAIDALETALLRNDDVVQSDSGTFPENYIFQRGTSHPAIREAISKLKSIK